MKFDHLEGKQHNPTSWGLMITMVINHLLDGRILQVRAHLVCLFQGGLEFFWWKVDKIGHQMTGDFGETRKLYMDVSENTGTPKSFILIGFSIILHPFWGTPIFGNTHIHLEPVVSWWKKLGIFSPFGNSRYFEKSRSSQPTKGWCENNSLQTVSIMKIYTPEI